MQSGTLHSEKTLPLTVANTGFLLDRMGEDCHPLQFLRELTQNAIEAILRTPEKKGEVIWDVDWDINELEGYYKLSVADNGDGMTGPEMVRYVNQLSSSISEQSFMGNYGVGAKIAAATRNHEGLIYLSWKDGHGAMVHLWRDPGTGEYGLRQIARPDGTFGHYAPIENDVKPPLIKSHGTKVILLGNSAEADTMAAPDGAASPSRWISKYLNSRYVRFPSGISVRAREGWLNPLSDTDRNVLRRLTGQSDYLRKHASSSGQVQLSTAVAHWWILKDEPALTNNSGFIESAGHIAALYNDELYEMATSRSGMTMLQQFGILIGQRRVVLYLQPELGGVRRLTTNTARTVLLIDNEPLPWAEWAAEFREKLPPAISSMMEEVAAGSSGTDHTKSIRERLKPILDLYKVSRYRPTPSGPVRIDSSNPSQGGMPRRVESGQRSGKTRSGRKGGTAGSIYSVFLKKDGEPGEEIQPDVFPVTKWVSVKDQTRAPGDLEDRAAKYLLDQNVLLVNADFRVYVDMIERWCTEYRGNPAITEIVTDAVRGWFEQALVETVLGVQSLQNSQEWSIEDIGKALSEEALTSAVMQRYHVNNSVKRELGTKLGKLQPA